MRTARSTPTFPSTQLHLPVLHYALLQLPRVQLLEETFRKSKMDGNNEEADMAALMGFSTFSEVPKLKRRKLEVESESTNSTSERKQEQSASSKPLSINPAPQNQAGGSSALHSGPHHSFNQSHRGRGGRGGRGGHGNQPHGNQKDDRPYYPSEETDEAHPVLSKRLDELTPADLHLLRGGVRDAQQDIVFFSKSMIEDPWQRIVHTGGSSEKEREVEG